MILLPVAHQLLPQLNLMLDSINFSLILVAREFRNDLGEDIATLEDAALRIVDVNNMPGLAGAHCFCRTLNENAAD